MAQKHLHIVALDVPYPPNYGAAIDMYFRVKCLNELGVKITLHCFDYGRGKPKELAEICDRVYYYPRKSALQCAFSREPYIVHSRRNKALFDRIFADDSPVLLEGTHTCACLTDPRRKGKKVFVRMHNIEEDYYRHLADAHSGMVKWYYYFEAKRLRRFENLLSEATGLFSVSEKDDKDLKAQFKNVHFMPPFIYIDKIECKPGRGEYALYHGNLSVAENKKAAKFIIDNVFKGLQIPLVVAGKGAKELSNGYPKSDLLKFVESPNGDELTELIKNAHVNVLPTFQPTGIKHKLVNALFQGRYCLVNSVMIEGIGVDGLCVIADSAAEMKEKVAQLFKQDFQVEEIKKRRVILENRYSNKKNAEFLVKTIFEE